jgi:hypothetical protein
MTPRRSLSAVFWIGVIGAMIFVGSLASQRLDFGLAHDEDLSARRAIVGEYIVTEDGRVLLPELKWRNTFFDYRKPTNHVLYSVLARSAWTVWGVFAPTGDLQIREWVLRLPAWLAGYRRRAGSRHPRREDGRRIGGRDIRLVARTSPLVSTLLI